MKARRVHSVGSLPVTIYSPRQALDFLRSALGNHARGQLAISETEQTRAKWYVLGIGPRLVRDVRGVRHVGRHKPIPLQSATLSKLPRYRLRWGSSLEQDRRAIDASLGYALENQLAWDELQNYPYQNEVTSLQAGIPSPLSVAAVMFWWRAFVPWRLWSPKGSHAWPYYAPLARSTVRQIQAIHRLMGDKVIFQIELPLETVLCCKLPAILRRIAAPLLARMVAKLINAMPEQARFGIHFCFGSLNNQPTIVPGSLEGIVALANAITQRLQPRRVPEFVHIPRGDNPGQLGLTYFSTIADLKYSRQSTRLVLGLARSQRPLVQQTTELAIVETVWGDTVDISPPCGLGRYPTGGEARTELNRAILLAQSD